MSLFPLALFLSALICWVVGEVKDIKKMRRIGAVVTLLGVGCIAWLYGLFLQLQDNLYYGRASKDLLVTLAESAPADSKQQKLLQSASEKFRPIYESKAHYDEVVREIIKDLKSGE